MDLTQDKHKQEAVKQWTADPCGFVGAGGTEVGSREFFEAIDRDRYGSYAPWMKSEMGFDRYRGKSVLEIGYGMGTDLSQFASGGARVSGVDLSPRHQEIARKRFEMYGLEGDLRLADAESLPFADGTFDLVYSFGVLHHTPGIEKALAEVRRVLKPGGEALISVYHTKSAFYVLSHLISSYLLRLRFLTESFRVHQARIEHRDNSDAVPLVRVYTEAGLRNLMKDFRDVTVRRRHLQKEHFGAFRFFVNESWLGRLESRWGWYLVARGFK